MGGDHLALLHLCPHLCRGHGDVGHDPMQPLLHPGGIRVGGVWVGVQQGVVVTRDASKDGDGRSVGGCGGGDQIPLGGVFSRGEGDVQGDGGVGLDVVYEIGDDFAGFKGVFGH